MRILTSNEIKDVENKCFEEYYDEKELMNFAGKKSFEAIEKKYGTKLEGSEISVLCGNGKNAGDGFIVARMLHEYGANATIIICDKMPTIPEPSYYFDKALRLKVKYDNFTPDCVENVDFIIDCMFGIGFKGEAREPFDEIFKLVNNSKATVISIDTPSGVDSTTGTVCQNAIKADFTVAISTLKFAHILPPANAYCGETQVIDIGIPQDCYVECLYNAIEQQQVKDYFIPRDKNSNKGNFGKQLNICGSYKMPGAAIICNLASLRSGTGLVKAVVTKNSYKLIASSVSQCVFEVCDENEQGTFSKNSVDTILNQLIWANSVVIGCGLSNNEETQFLTQQVVKNANCPIIIDADGINSLVSGIDIIKGIKVPVVLTPHPGEMARLISKTPEYVQNHRIECAKSFASEYGVIVVLKGANTVVTDGKNVFVNTNGNPGMAMGGTGDMLSGMIGSFVSQGLTPLQAATAAVYIHGKCGDITANKISRRGMIVFDMIEQLGALMSEFD